MVSAMVSFGWPFALLLLPMPWLLRWLLKARPPAMEQAINAPPLLEAQLSKLQTRAGLSFDSNRLLLLLGWTLLVLSIAQPRLASGEQIYPASGRALVLAIDLSGSMERTDFELDGERADRLSVVKRVARDFIRKRQGDRIGLVLFGDEAFSASPLSFDLSAIGSAVANAAISMAGRTTAIGEALGLAIVKLRTDPAKEKAVILLSDGTNNSGGAEPEDAARLAAQFGIRIHTIGLGSEKAPDSANALDPSADLDEETLREIARLSGGIYQRARTTAELDHVYVELDKLEAAEAIAPPFVPRLDLRNYFLPGLFAVVALLGWTEWRQSRQVTTG